jgi:GNAT superfamily N-acetyltransferase
MELLMNEQPHAPAWPDGVQVRTFVPNQDEQATFRADEEAAEDKGYHQPLDFEAWAKRMGLNTERFDPSLWFLAWDGNQIAGVALNYHDQKSDTGWIDHLGVRRAWRNKGIGKALLLHSFREFYQRGVRRIKLSVDAKSLTNAPQLYESVGMRTIHKYDIYKKELPIA